MTPLALNQCLNQSLSSPLLRILAYSSFRRQTFRGRLIITCKSYRVGVGLNHVSLTPKLQT